MFAVWPALEDGVSEFVSATSSRENSVRIGEAVWLVGYRGAGTVSGVVSGGGSETGVPVFRSVRFNRQRDAPL